MLFVFIHRFIDRVRVFPIQMPSLLPPLQRLDPKQFTHHPDFDTELQKLSLESQTEYRAKTLPRFMTSKYSMAGNYLRKKKYIVDELSTKTCAN